MQAGGVQRLGVQVHVGMSTRALLGVKRGVIQGEFRVFFVSCALLQCPSEDRLEDKTKSKVGLGWGTRMEGGWRGLGWAGCPGLAFVTCWVPCPMAGDAWLGWDGEPEGWKCGWVSAASEP